MMDKINVLVVDVVIHREELHNIQPAYNEFRNAFGQTREHDLLAYTLGKKITDFGHDPNAGNDEGIDETYGIPVQVATTSAP